MKKTLGDIIGNFRSELKEYFQLLFSSAAENQMRIAKVGGKKFRSYTQLKRTQKRIRTVGTFFSITIVSLLIGFFGYPLLLPSEIDPEVYIPNGKGDILIGNISKNQATVVFKTLDSANDNKPLATKASIAAYSDREYKNLITSTPFDEYAVTHIISVDSLKEGEYAYLKIMATDAGGNDNDTQPAVVSSWGDGHDPIKVYATGEAVSFCEIKNQPTVNASQQEILDAIDEKIKAEIGSTPVAPTGYADGVAFTDESKAKSILQEHFVDEPNISEVEHESYLYENNKVQTIISWKTSVPATTALLYREGNSGTEKEIAMEKEKTTKHAAITLTFEPGKTYYFRVKSQMDNGDDLLSEEYSLRTPKAKENAMQTIKAVFTSLVHEIKPGN